MTPAQRKYDRDLIAALQVLARNIEPRSRKLSDALKLAAGRIDALSSMVPVDTPTQPASNTGSSKHA